MKATKSDSPGNAVDYKRTPNRLDQMPEHEAVKERGKETLKIWRENVQLSAKFEQHRPAFLDTLTVLQSIWDRYLGRINVSKHSTELLNDKVWPVHSAPYRARPTARQFAAAEFNRMIT